MNLKSTKEMGNFFRATLRLFSLKKKTITLAVLFASILFEVSCVSKKQVNKLTYFPALNDTTLKLVNNTFEPLIQTGDILYVAVNSLDPVSSTLFNSSNSLTPSTAFGGTTASSFTSTITPGYIVSKDGFIELPKIGKLTVQGKTTSQVSKEIQLGLLRYLKEPLVTVRYMNFRITVLGEVNRPGTISISNERVSVLEALGLCNDLTIFGNRSNILLIRDSSGIKQIHRINLNDNSLFKIPYFYLQNNDVLYVEPNKAREFTSTTAPEIIPIIFSSLSILIIILDRVFR